MYNELKSTCLDKAGVRLLVHREDALHPIVGGNKMRKLFYNLIHFKQNNYHTILTFGGAYSNHIAAVAYTGFIHGIKTIGIIRGNELSNAPLKNVTLNQAAQHGMQLVFVDRKTYANRYCSRYHNELLKTYGNIFIIPEGGCNELGLQGCGEIIKDIEVSFDYVVCPVGTATTLAGIASVLPNKQAIGIQVTQSAIDLPVQTILKVDLENRCHIFNNAAPGYGRSNDDLNVFCANFANAYNIPIEPIYTGKMFQKLFQLIEQGWFKRGDTIVAIHTGGLQYLQL